jgi:hypothetical protein
LSHLTSPRITGLKHHAWLRCPLVRLQIIKGSYFYTQNPLLCLCYLNDHKVCPWMCVCEPPKLSANSWIFSLCFYISINYCYQKCFLYSYSHWYFCYKSNFSKYFK